MSKSAENLVRDLARLLIKYPLDDWKSVLMELGDKKRSSSIGAAVEDIFRNRPKTKVRTKPKLQRPAFAIKGDHKEILTPLLRALQEGRLLASRSDFKAVYAAVGPKEPLSTARKKAIEQLIGHLDQLDSASLEIALAKIASQNGRTDLNVKDEYQRWFEMIVGTTPE